MELDYLLQQLCFALQESLKVSTNDANYKVELIRSFKSDNKNEAFSYCIWVNINNKIIIRKEILGTNPEDMKHDLAEEVIKELFVEGAKYKFRD